ncbi:MAG: chemotaxis protein CheA [Gammaproteobacteria bacterium]
MDLNEALDTFIAESRDLLAEMEEVLLSLEGTAGRSHPDQEPLNALFRCAHTIKGSAGIFGLDRVVEFTHVVENVLDRVRDGTIGLEPSLTALLFRCRDHIQALIEVDTDDLPEDLSIAGRTLAQALSGYQEQDAPLLGLSAVEPQCDVQGDPSVRKDDTWHISVRFGASVLRHGMDPLGFIGYLRTLGEIAYISTIADGIPDADNFDPESCYLGFEIALKGQTKKAVIEDVFEFVRDECELRILPPGSQVTEYIELIHSLPEDNLRLGEMLVASEALTARELAEGLKRQEAAGAGEMAKPIGQVLVDSGSVQPEIVNAALDKQLRERDRRARAHQYVRVQADKLDSLINLVGELVIAAAAATLSAKRAGDTATQEAMTVVSGLVEEIRDNSLAVRMVPVGETFQRFQRVVRDVAIELDKDIRLAISGADTELDKTVVEKIADPLTHLVRNAMDHGIEPAERRVELGKPAQGTVRLNAFHEAGSVVIEVTDDGGGLNRERILTRALERGLVENTEGMPDQDVLQLIFEAGFSTAAQVTNLSGRGVGMDVVKRSIEALRGTVTLESTEGVGTTVRIRLPLTLAIIDGLLVGVGDGSYVIPLAAVSECAEMQLDLGNSGQCSFMNLRGEVLPLLELRSLFAAHGEISRRANVVVVQAGGRKAGLVVDRLLGEYQTVIKPMGRLFEHVKGVSGSTVLGDGQVALILDVASLIERTASVESRTVGELGGLAARVG